MSGIPAGYKQTEAGVIPKEWEVMALGEIGDVRMCKRVLKQQTRDHGDVPFYKIGTFGDVADAFISYALFDEFKRKYSFPKKGDVLISAAGTIGRTVVYDGAPAYFQDSNIVWIENDESKTTNAYLWHRYQITKWAVSHGGTVARLYNDNLRTKIHVPVPPLLEQRAIAAALSDVDALLAKLDQFIAKKRDLKQAAMQQLLTGQTRLPGFSGAWEVKRLGDVADPNQKWSFTGGPFGSNLKFSDYTDEGVRIIQLQNIGDGEFHDDYAIYTSAEKAVELLSCNVYPGDIILSKMGDPVARACLVPSTDQRYLMCSDGIRLAVDQTRFNTKFVFFQINASSFRSRAENAGTGSTRKRIGLTQLRNLELTSPSLGEQTAIATVLSDMDTELAALEARRDKTRALKQGMMQELLTGRIRLV